MRQKFLEKMADAQIDETSWRNFTPKPQITILVAAYSHRGGEDASDGLQRKNGLRDVSAR